VNDARPSTDWHRTAVTTYLIGAAAACAWLSLGYGILWRTLLKAAPAPPEVQQRIDGSARVLVVAGLRRPFTCGFWRPKIVLPTSLLIPGRERQLRQVLLHELGHVRR